MYDIVVEDCDIDVRGAPINFSLEPSITLKAFGNVSLRDLRNCAKRPIV